jgi:hypothetical protein
VGATRKKTGTGRKERKESEECAMTMRSEIRKTERKERGRILNEDGREIGWMKELWKRRDKMEKERGGGIERKIFFWNCYFLDFRGIRKEKSL